MDLPARFRPLLLRFGKRGFLVWQIISGKMVEVKVKDGIPLLAEAGITYSSSVPIDHAPVNEYAIDESGETVGLDGLDKVYAAVTGDYTDTLVELFTYRFRFDSPVFPF